MHLLQRRHQAQGMHFTDRERVLAAAVIESACALCWRIATAEACSAGMIACLLSRIEGAGACLQGGIVAYTKDMKQRALGVPGRLLDEQTAVSAHVAQA